MEYDIPTLRRQLVQLKELHEAGVLPAAQYEEGKAALERRVLDLVMSGAADIPPSSPAALAGANAATGAPGQPTTAPVAPKPSSRLVITLTIAILAVAAGGYWWMGSPTLVGGGPVASGSPAGGASGGAGGEASHPTSTEQIAAMVDKLAARMKEAPDDAEGWAMLARSYTVLGRHPEALTAYEKAVKLRKDDPQLLADYADSLAVKNDRKLAGEPMKWVEAALKLDPKNLKALALAGTYAFERKDYAAAVKYWDQVVEVGPPDSNYVQQVQAGLVEARQLGGLPPPKPTAKAPAAAGAAPAAAAQGPSALVEKAVSGTVSLSPALSAQVSPGDTVFIFARAAEGEQRMPLAILRKQAKELPIAFTLDDSSAMSPAAKISDAKSVIISARISKTGEALPKPGDLSGQSAPVSVGTSALKIEIRDQVK